MTQDSGVIYALMGGRLGNQLFQYATVKALKTKFHPHYEIKANFFNFQNLNESQKSDKGWENSLRYFRIKDIEYINESPRKNRNFLQRAFCFGRDKILRRLLPQSLMFYADKHVLQPIFNRFGLYNPLRSAPALCRSFSRKIFYSSYSWNVRHFDFIRSTLLEYFTPIHDPLPHNLGLLNDIMTSESVCVTIRRGDFLSPKNASTFNVCNEEYFITAMKAIREEIPDCKFFVFSDDIEDVKRVMHFPFEVTYEKGNDPVWEKLRLMYSCRHFIISNSTFSWWAQYLGRNPNKIVYAPIPWLWGIGNGESIYQSYVRTIQCYR